jgi:hypothetical protein
VGGMATGAGDHPTGNGGHFMISWTHEVFVTHKAYHRVPGVGTQMPSDVGQRDR